jgi:regulator of RNase E activity RraB
MPVQKEKHPQAVERVADGAEADELVLDHLARLGDPEMPHEVHHFLYLPTPNDADAVARTLARDGWTTSVEESEGAWLVTAMRTRALTSKLVRDTRAQLALLAAEHDGVYDGWEALRQ